MLTILRNDQTPLPLGATVTAPARRRSRFEELLLAQSLLRGDQLEIAIDDADRRHLALVDAVIEHGFVPEIEAYAILAASMGMPMLDLSEATPSALALRLVPERIARRHKVVPLEENNRSLTYATSRPLDADADRDLRFASGRTPRAVIATPSGILDALDRAYPRLAEIDFLLERVRCEASVQAVDVDESSALSESPVIELCNHIVARAVQAGASDVHLEPTLQGLSVRYRIGGILEPSITIPADAAPLIGNRYKVMGRADIAVRHRPQDGAFRLLVDERPIDVRLSTLPTINGEKIVMRIIDSRTCPQTLDVLGYDEDNLRRLRQALNRPDGLVLVTGPTGSGKTTVLYSALNHLRTGHTNIVSIEDPVERRVVGVNQIAVNTRGGNSFAAVIKSVLRQDPNVLMVGEIRDGEVAQIVGQAAYTGQLVLSSLHTSDAASAITRLLNLGLEPFKVAESLSAIVAQRLIRRLCPRCMQAVEPEEAVALGRAHGIASVPMRVGHGCDACRQTGYVARMPVAEVLVPDDQIRDAIVRGATASEIRAAMHAAGCKSMRERALELVAAGMTSLDEVDRVLAPDAQQATRARGGKRVLIVDDDRITRMLVKLLLERDGYEVLEGENGRHAVEIAQRERPDLLIIDLMMPEMDGYQAIERARQDVSLATLPVMVLTAEDGPGIEHRVLQLGADDYIVKPFEPEILLARVRATFRRLERLAA